MPLVAIHFGKALGWSLLGPDPSDVFGSHEGRLMFGLLVGLLILTVIGFIPYLGGLVRLGVLCCKDQRSSTASE